MNRGFIYTRWLLALTFCSLMGLLAVGMMSVHSKRIIRSLAVSINSREAQMEELGRRQDILDTELASSLNPEYLKELIAMSKLNLGPPREDRVIIVPATEKSSNQSISDQVPVGLTAYRSRLELANSEPRERD